MSAPTLRYSAHYDWLGHTVQIVPGAKVRRVSDRGTLDRRMVDVRIVAGGPVGLVFSAPVDELTPTGHDAADEVTEEARR